MRSAFIQRLCGSNRVSLVTTYKVLDPVRASWNHLAHLPDMNLERLSSLGLEPMLTTTELAEYLGVHVQAIYDLRTTGRGPSAIRVGRELRYRVSEVNGWLDRLHEPEPGALRTRGEL